jgi:hypothetical protein
MPYARFVQAVRRAATERLEENLRDQRRAAFIGWQTTGAAMPFNEYLEHFELNPKPAGPSSESQHAPVTTEQALSIAERIRASDRKNPN